METRVEVAYPTVPPETEALQIGFLLRVAHVRAAHAFAEALRPLGLQPKHIGVLSWAAHGQWSQRELVERLGSDKASMARLVDELEGMGLVRRETAQQDRRRNQVTLTGSGQQLLQDAHEVGHRVVTRLVAHMDEGHAHQLNTLLHEFLAGPTA